MKQKIYTSSFRTGPDATKKQQMLFATDTAYALSEGYGFIEDSQGIVYQIIDEHNIVELGDHDEDCDGNCSEWIKHALEQEPTEVPFAPTEPAETIDNCATIDRVIHNTLNQRVPLRADQIDSLLKLGQLRILLEGRFNE